MQKLPVDISTFSQLRTSNYLYVDKTEYMYNMITGGRRFFLSRPRRFGKSLLVSTLKEILTANKTLFDDLWIASSDYDWQEYGVINLDFSKLTANDPIVFQANLSEELLSIAEHYKININVTHGDANYILMDLARMLYKKFGRVAILINEYDSPIVKTWNNKEPAKNIGDCIQQFFTIIKSLDEYIQFAFITGTNPLIKTGFYAGANNVQILTLRDEYAAICGYTDQEIDHYFSQHIAAWSKQNNISYDELRHQIKTQYSGYHFGDDVVAVYNPFSVMNALHIKEFENFWFQSGTPTFLVELLKKEYTYLDLEKPQVSQDFLVMFDRDNLHPLSAMFQEGYLAIIGYDREFRLYTLDCPNEEVRIASQKLFAHINSFATDKCGTNYQHSL